MIRTKTTRTRQLSILICAVATLFFVTGCGGGSGTESVSAPVSAGIGATAGRNPANVINSAIASAVELTIDVSADSAAGETLSVTLSDGALEVASPAIPTTVGGGSVTVGPIDASALADGTIEVRVTVANGSSQVMTSFGAILSKDTVAPILPLLAVVPEGEQDAPNPEGVINQNNEDAVTVNVDFDASASSADLLSIICSDGQTSIETVQQNAIPGGQNVFTSIDLSSLTDGPISITVQMVDSNDNFSSWLGAAEKDVAIASVNSAWIASTPANAQGVVNTTTESAVTVQIELGDEALASDLVTVEVWSDADAAYRILAPAQNAVEGGGTMLFEGLDVSDLSDGNLTCQISITDVNHNAANTSGDPALLDTTLTTASSVGVSAGAGNAANVVNTSNIATAEVLVDFGSTASAAGDTLEVFVDHAGGSLSSGLITLPDGEFTHQVTFDLTGITEGNLVTRAISGDSAGNVFEGGGFNLTFDATPPAGHTSAFVASTAGNPQGTVIQVNDTAAVIAVDVAADSDTGRSIQVQISDGSTTISSSVESASTSGGMMQFAAMDLSGLQEGSLTINAIYTDSAGNSMTQMGTGAIHDVSVPTPSTGSVSAGASNAANTVNASNASGVVATINLPAGTSNSDVYQLRFKAPGQTSDLIAISAPVGGGMVTFPAMDVSTLPDGMIAMTVVATDIYGNMMSWAGPLVSKDTVAPGSPATAYVLSGASNAVNEINSSNAATTGARVQMSATSGSDETVSVTLRDSAGASITSMSQLTNGPGAFIDFLTINASGLTDGNIDVMVNLSDAAGNATTWVVATALKSTQAVVPTSAVVASGPSNAADIINISSVGTVQIDVAMPAASLATDLVTVTLNGGGSVMSAGQAAPLGGGTMSFIMDASTLSNGSVAIEVDVLAASTNTSTFTGSPAMMDTVAPTTPTSAIVPSGLDRPANAINALSASAVLLEMAWPTGADAADQVAFEMTDGAASVNAATFSPMPGTTQGYTHDLSALADGPITLNVVVTDAAGNTSAFTGSPVAKDVVAPVAPSAGGIGAGAGNAVDYINISNMTSAGVTLTWPAGAVATDLFKVTIVGGLGTSIVSSNMNPTPGASTWTSFDTSSLADGPISFKVDMFDTVGNMAPFSPNAATKDTIAPNPSLGQIVAVGASNPANWVNGTSESLVMVDVTFGGGSQSSETATVWLSGGTQSTAMLQQATPAGAGVLTFGPFDASALADGSVKVFVDIADAAGNTAQAFGGASKDSVAPTTPTSMLIPAALDLPANYINILSQSAAFVEMAWPTGSDTADQVTLDITDGTSTVSAAAFSPMPGTTQGYTFDLSTLADGGVALNMQVTDAAGNVSVYVGSPIAKDTVAPAAPTSGGIGAGAGNAADFINISNATAAGVELFWPASAEATDYYTITMTDSASAIIASGILNPTPGAASWASFDTTALVDGPISFKVDLFDPAGNPAPFTPNAAAKDTVAPIAALSQTVALGGSNPLGYINASSESAVMVDVSFDAASAATETATVWLDDGSQQTATIALSAMAGAGTLSFGPFNAAAIADGSVKVFVDINDAAGNSTSTFNTATKDSVAPDAPTIAQVKVGPSNAADIINAASVAAVTVEVTWGPTADAAADAFVTLGGSLSSATSNPTPGAAQSWLGLDASALADGPLTVDVTVTDVAGNATTFAGTAATKDTITPEAPTALTVKTGPSNATDIINIASAGAVTVEATWAATADATADAFVTLGGSTISATGNPTPGANQDWAGLDASALADGPLTVVMTVTDAAGNATTFAGIDATKDTVAPDAPTIAQVKVGPSNAADIINTNSVAAVTVEVTWPATADATADAFVTVGGSLVSATQNPTAGAAQDYAGFDCSALAEGSITVDVSVTDAAGNPTTFVGTTATKDTTIVAASSASIPATAGNNTDTISSATAAAVTVDVTFPATADGTESATIDLTGGATVTSVSQPIPAGGGAVTFAAINCSTLTDGAINVTVNVTDANQNTASAVTLVATMDTAAPALPTTAIVAATVNNPQDFINATTASSVTVELTFPASSNADDLATVTLSDGALNTVSTPVNAPAGGGTVQALALNTSAFADGAVTVSVDMVDGSLNASGPFAGTSATQDVVAPADPTVDPITSPTNQAAQTITGTADVSTSIIIDGGAAQATGTSSAAGAFALSTTLAATATNNLTIYAEDAAGNRSAGQTVDYNTAALSILQDPTAADAPFTNATATYLPVNSNGAADGGAFADFDGDGDLDLFVASAASGILYQYDSVAGQFNDISVSAGGPFIGDVCAIWGDYDNDGDLDLLTVDAVIGSTLYRNDIIGLGTTTFTDVTATELAGVTGTLSQAFWLDYDNDGFLDFLVVNSDGAGNYLMQNQRGQGVPSNTFVRDSAAGIDAAGTSKFWGAVCDFDVDGDADVVYGGTTPGYFWQNSGAATFADIAGITSNVTWDHSAGGRGTAWVDYDNDGDFDLYIARGAAGPFNQLWRNDGGGSFTEVAALAGLDTDVDADDICWGDVNNDGFIDLYVGSNTTNRLYLGLGDTNADTVFEFSEVSVVSTVDDAGDAGMVQMGDVDGDGDLELFVGNEGAFDVLYDNDLNNFNYLKVIVAGQGAGAGTASADGRGAIVTLKDSTGTITLATREINGGRGAGSQDTEHCHFGGVTPSLGYTVEVRFPSGAVVTQVVTPRFAPNHTVTISE